jgi:hypothetical protein
MKTPIKILFLLSFFLFSDCKKDNPENYFIYDGKTYSLDGGLLGSSVKDGMSGAYNFNLTLYSSGLTFNQVTNQFSGSGEMLNFLISSYTTSLQSRAYTYGSGPGTYSGCWLKHNITTSTNTSTDIELHAGTLAIVDTGSSVYSISININTRDGKSINGYYKGILGGH